MWLFRSTPLRRFAMRTETTERFSSHEAYDADRTEQVEGYRTLFAPWISMEGKTVAELGCARGYLLDAFQRSAGFTAIGIDREPQVLRLGAQAFPAIRFVQSTDVSIPLESGSVDVLYTIDTMERLSRPLEILGECARVLRPGGTMLVHFGPWLNPYGSHLEDIIPFPWPHVLFSMDTLLAVSARLYDSPHYRPACYWFDAETGERRTNPFREREHWDQFLNHMTIRGFRKILPRLPFEVRHFETLGFGGRRFALARHATALAHLPVLDEFFTKAVFCVLRKPAEKEVGAPTAAGTRP